MINKTQFVSEQHHNAREVSNMACLFIVPTPIGNLEDITLRAMRVLQEADIIACEDTRVTGRLLHHLEIPRKRLISVHARNEQAKIAEVLNALQQGMRVAVVSDAGMPGMSDPGMYLVTAVIAAGIKVEALPGPNAAITALVASGLSTKSVLFEGFLPHKKGRQTRIKELAGYRETIVLYESPHRILRTLRELAVHFGEERPAVVGRELTKLFEEYNRGTLKDVLEDYEGRTAIKGEFVVIIEGVRKSRSGSVQESVSG